MLETWADTVARQLNAAQDGRWYVWYVRGPYSPTTWHARPAGSEVATVHAESPEDLIAAIAQQEAMRPADT
jgi:hypothetical protein